MKYTYIVTWALYVACGCPDYKPDQFGRYPTATCAVLHMAKEKHSKEFDNRKEAIAFYGEAQSEGLNFFSRLCDVKFDSIKAQ